MSEELHASSKTQTGEMNQRSLRSCRRQCIENGLPSRGDSTRYPLRNAPLSWRLALTKVTSAGHPKKSSHRRTLFTIPEQRLPQQQPAMQRSLPDPIPPQPWSILAAGTGATHLLEVSSPFHAYPFMHTAVLPSSLLSMRSYTSWTPTIDQHASYLSPLHLLIASGTRDGVIRTHLGGSGKRG